MILNKSSHIDLHWLLFENKEDRARYLGWMDGWIVILCDDGLVIKLCASEPCLRLKRFLPPADKSAGQWLSYLATGSPFRSWTHNRHSLLVSINVFFILYSYFHNFQKARKRLRKNACMLCIHVLALPQVVKHGMVIWRECSCDRNFQNGKCHIFFPKTPWGVEWGEDGVSHKS